MNILDPEILRDTIMEERSAGIVTVDYRSIEDFSKATNKVNVDSYVSTLGFSPLGDGWQYLRRNEAREILKGILERDLAYEAELMDSTRADLLADSFLGLFLPTGSRYLSNGSLAPGSSGWNPITSSTFDHGILAYDHQHIGIVWVQDED